MAAVGGSGRAGRGVHALPAATLALLSGCAILPAEFNLSPIYRHRLDADGTVLEMDVLWPIFHYEQTPAGGDDFRVRPLYRYVSEGDITEHQFLWPLGRVRSDPVEHESRFWPLWYHAAKVDENGQRDDDWYFLFPFFWGGSHESEAEGEDEDYVAMFPLYADIPEFLVYDRFRVHLWPIHTQVDKNGHEHHVWLWPFIAYGNCEAAGDHEWFRIWPLYHKDVQPGRHARYWVLWPFLHWGTENLEFDDPVSTFWLWPFIGRRTGRDTDSWSVLWPFFQKDQVGDHHYELEIFWPFFHYEEKALRQNLVSWWLWPFYGRTTADDQDSWSIAWPLIWWREYDDPEGTNTQQWILPIYWHVNMTRNDGSERDLIKIWPLAHNDEERDPEGRLVGGDWQLISPWPWRTSNAVGVHELYGWLWTLARGVQRAPDDRTVELAAHLFTRRKRKGRVQASVPFLFNYESDEEGSVLRLFQFLPIPFGGGSGQ